jgi:hypothetical protein
LCTSVVVAARSTGSVYLNKSKQWIAFIVIAISIGRRNWRISVNTSSIQANLKSVTNVVIK